MPTGGGSFEQAYNAQALVDTATHLVLGTRVTQAPNDKQQLIPGLEELGELPAALGKAKRILADNGYFSEPNVEAATDQQIEPLIALGRQVHNVPLAERLGHPDEPSEEASPLEQMAYCLKTSEGRSKYALRKSTVETVFGMIKSAMGFRHFHLQGHEKVEGEWTLVSIAYNLKRLFRLVRDAFEGTVFQWRFPSLQPKPS